MTEIEAQEPGGISRRTVTKAMAWAVPAIAIASPVPAFAASQGIITFNGGGCKLPGQSNPVFKGNAFRMQATNTTDTPITITITQVTLNGEDLGAFSVIQLDGCTVLGSSFVVPANTSLANLAIVTQNAGSSENGTLTVFFTVSGIPGTQQASTGFNSIPPINGASCSVFSQSEKDCIATSTA